MLLQICQTKLSYWCCNKVVSIERLNESFDIFFSLSEVNKCN